MDGSLPRELAFAGVFNFRDVGGYPTRDGRSVRWRRLFRSDALSNLTEEDRESFLALGVRTVVDLRRRYEIEMYGRVPDWDGLAYHNIAPDHREWTDAPFEHGTDPVRYLADRYRDMAEEGVSGMADAIGMIADEDASPLVVHCMAGKDRTGVVCALTLALLGVSDDDIDADYTRSTANNLRYMEWVRANGRPDLVMQPWYYSLPGTMKLFLAELRARHGSVAGYLRQGGIGPAQITALQAHLLAPPRPDTPGGR